MLQTVTTIEELREPIKAWHRAGETVGLVPTMGALHEGHLALVRVAAARADRVVVSIFVNPSQFAPHEDLDHYPRDLEHDAQILGRTGAVQHIYAPGVDEIYPEGFAAGVLTQGSAAGLETDFRPQFLGGVVSVVSKLFLQCKPDIAVFGEKDYQQLLVVRRLVRDLELGIEIVSVPTVREEDGLAISSRNAYLSEEERPIAPALARSLRAVAERTKSGHPIAESEAEGAAALLIAGFDSVDYLAIRDAETLAPIRDLARPARVLAAAKLGTTRLIDNMAV